MTGAAGFFLITIGLASTLSGTLKLLWAKDCLLNNGAADCWTIVLLCWIDGADNKAELTNCCWVYDGNKAAAVPFEPTNDPEVAYEFESCTYSLTNFIIT